MVMLAFDNPRETARRPALTEREKAMLFDLAMAAGGSRGEGRDDTLAAAPLIRAFAQAYVTIRDREDGIV